MKLSIFPEIKKDDKVRLRLIDTDDEIRVIAVNENGTEVAKGHLVAFKSDGTIRLEKYVNKDLGFKLGSFDQITIEE